MRGRIDQLMKEERLTALKFAEILEVQPSSISHILSGRNKPSFDFIEKLLSKFPQLSPDWLILGKGEMYRSSTPKQDANERSGELYLFDDLQKDDLLTNNQYEDDITNVQYSDNQYDEDDIVTKVKTEKAIEKVIILYSDGTFSDYNK